MLPNLNYSIITLAGLTGRAYKDYENVPNFPIVVYEMEKFTTHDGYDIPSGVYVWIRNISDKMINMATVAPVSAR